MPGNIYTGFPKGVVGKDARDKVERPRKLKLKAPKFGEPEQIVRTSNNRSR